MRSKMTDVLGDFMKRDIFWSEETTTSDPPGDSQKPNPFDSRSESSYRERQHCSPRCAHNRGGDFLTETNTIKARSWIIRDPWEDSMGSQFFLKSRNHIRSSVKYT
jgi:hypothetical protein